MDRIIKIITRSAVIENGFVWCVDLKDGINILLKISMENFKVIEAHILEFQGQASLAFTVESEEKLYCVSENELCCFDRDSKKQQLFKLPHVLKEVERVYSYGDKIYILPKYLSDKMIIFNSHNNLFEEKDIFADIWQRDRRLLITAVKDGKCYITVQNDKSFYIYNMGEAKVRKHEGSGECVNISGLVIGENCVYFMCDGTSKLIKWDMERECYCYIKSTFVFSGIFRGVSVGERLYLCNAKDTEKLYEMHEEGEVCVTILKNANLHPIHESGSLFVEALQYKGMTFLLPWNMNEIISIDGNGEISCHKIKATDDIMEIYEDAIFYNNCLISENNLILKDFIEYVRRSQD